MRESFGDPEAVSDPRVMVCPATLRCNPALRFSAQPPSWTYAHGRSSVHLYFEAERLARWEVFQTASGVSSSAVSSGYTDPFPSTMTFPSKDSIHHGRGHEHHHGHK